MSKIAIKRLSVEATKVSREEIKSGNEKWTSQTRLSHKKQVRKVWVKNNSKPPDGDFLIFFPRLVKYSCDLPSTGNNSIWATQEALTVKTHGEHKKFDSRARSETTSNLLGTRAFQTSSSDFDVFLSENEGANFCF